MMEEWNSNICQFKNRIVAFSMWEMQNFIFYQSILHHDFIVVLFY